MDDLHRLTARDALRLFRSRELSPVELVEAVIRRAEDVEPAINAFPHTYYEEALAAARAGSEPEARIAIARFFAEHLAPSSSGLEREVIEGADSISEIALA